MRISKIKLNTEHWTTEYIPISYKNIITPSQYKKSFTFYWTTDYNLHALCRVYYIDKNRIEIGDVWLNEKLRGKKIDGVKISLIFMRKIILKIWQLFKDSNQISLIVDKDNVKAIKLYQNLHFKFKKNVTNKQLNIDNGLFMIRKKKS
jgi:hypothetical protein